jgi:3-(3-hydroxy-phenyl)propionate hydroxylase
MKDFRARPVLFVGDAAHQVSPFGARGANSGVQDADNLLWKLKLVHDGLAPQRLLDSYDRAQRVFAADENILNSTRSTDFITPKSRPRRSSATPCCRWRRKCPAAVRWSIRAGLSVPSILDRSSLNTPDSERFGGWMVPGAPMDDAPVKGGWLLQHAGNRFVLMLFADGPLTPTQHDAITVLAQDRIAVHTLVVVPPGTAAPEGVKSVEDLKGLAAKRYDAKPGTCVLLRPDQHVAARWRTLDAAAVRAAVARATCNA